jgi:hypothetical protein
MNMIPVFRHHKLSGEYPVHTDWIGKRHFMELILNQTRIKDQGSRIKDQGSRIKDLVRLRFLVSVTAARTVDVRVID